MLLFELKINYILKLNALLTGCMKISKQPAFAFKVTRYNNVYLSTTILYSVTKKTEMDDFNDYFEQKARDDHT